MLLQQLLQRRFGELPATIRDRIAAAPIPELDRWAERLFDAASLDDVFAAD